MKFRVALLAAALAGAAGPAAAQEFFAFGYVQRGPEQGGPPWKEITSNIRFYHKAQRWAPTGAVTLIPADARLPALALQLAGVEPRSTQACTDTERAMWPAKLSPIADPDWVNGPRLGETADVPALVVLPAKPNAKPLPATSVTDVPRRMPAHTVKHAFDLDGDGKADVVYLTWCTGKPVLKPGQCGDATQSHGLFRRTAQGWRRIWEDDEC
jgi:hypothetical protein